MAHQVEHSVPQCKGGSDHGNNLYAAHIRCNREKRRVMTRTARGWNGKTKAPISVGKRKVARTENTFLGAVSGDLAGLAVGGPIDGIHWLGEVLFRHSSLTFSQRGKLSPLSG